MRTCAPYPAVGGKGPVFGADGDWDFIHPSRGGLDLMAMARVMAVASTGPNYRIFLHSGLKAMFNS